MKHIEYVLFQSTPSAWRETLWEWQQWLQPTYFNPLPPHGGRLEQKFHIAEPQHISIHSLRMEGDGLLLNRLQFPAYISIHSLRMEGDPPHIRQCAAAKHFNPLPPHGGRRWNSCEERALWAISIHSLRMEGDDGSSYSALPCE